MPRACRTLRAISRRVAVRPGPQCQRSIGSSSRPVPSRAPSAAPTRCSNRERPFREFRPVQAGVGSRPPSNPETRRSLPTPGRHPPPAGGSSAPAGAGPVGRPPPAPALPPTPRGSPALRAAPAGPPRVRRVIDLQRHVREVVLLRHHRLGTRQPRAPGMHVHRLVGLQDAPRGPVLVALHEVRRPVARDGRPAFGGDPVHQRRQSPRRPRDTVSSTRRPRRSRWQRPRTQGGLPRCRSRCGVRVGACSPGTRPPAGTTPVPGRPARRCAEREAGARNPPSLDSTAEP